MELSLDNFYLSNDTKNNINNWISSIKNKQVTYPLIIYGKNGIGKRSLSNIILNEYNIIEYTPDLDINDCLLTGDISSLFTNKLGKSLIIYGYSIISKNIIEKINMYINKPIIIILNILEYSQKNKYLYRKCEKIYINYTNDQWLSIIKNICIHKKIENINYKDLLIKSNYNLHNIFANIHYYNNNIKTINKYDIVKEDVINISNKILYNEITYNEIENYFYNYNTLILLTILDNIHYLIKINNEYLNLSYIKSICQMYHYITNYDIIILNNIINESYIAKSYFFLSISLIKQIKINIYNISYNKYISKSIISIPIINILNRYPLSFYYYDIIDNYYKLSNTEFKLKYNNQNINNRIINGYYKLYNFINNKTNNIRKFDKLIKGISIKKTK